MKTILCCKLAKAIPNFVREYNNEKQGFVKQKTFKAYLISIKLNK